MKPNIEIFVDGSCPVPHAAGGWAYIIRILPSRKEKRGSGGERVTTNNRMELSALIEALKVLPCSCLIKIVSDSQYVIYGISKWKSKWKKNGWKKKNEETKQWELIKNVDLWQELDSLLLKHDILEAEWVKGHAGHIENEEVDRMAGLETRKILNEIKNEGLCSG